MISNSNAIVLKRFPYGESSIIAKCFVRNRGKLSFIVHGARRKKSSRSAHFQPTNCLDIVYYYKPTKNLQTISSQFITDFFIICSFRFSIEVEKFKPPEQPEGPFKIFCSIPTCQLA